MSNYKAYSAHPALALEQLQCTELFKNQQNATQIQHRRHNSSGNLFDSTSKSFSRKISMPIMLEQRLSDVVTLTPPPPHEILPDRTVRKNNEHDDEGDDDNSNNNNNNNNINIDLTEGGDNYAVIDEDELITTTTTTTTKDCVNCANNCNDIYDDEPDCRTNLPIPTTTTTTTAITTIKPTLTTSHEKRIRNSQSPYRVSLNRHHLSQLQQHLALGDKDIEGSGDIVVVGSTGYLSGVSSTISSPSASTVSTPLSTPTREPHTPNHHHQQQQQQQLHHNQHYHNHHQVHKCNQHCCQYKQNINNNNNNNSKQQKQSAAFVGSFLMGGAAGTATSTTTTTTPTISKSRLESKYQHKHQHQQQQQQLHQQQHNFHHTASSTSSSTTSSPINKNNNNNNGGKKIKKFDPRLGPSPYRQLLPIALCILSFAVVFSLLIIYMDTTEIRHQQFRLNMSRDYDMYGVVQDDPQLIAFLREIHMRKYPMHFLKSRADDGITSTTTTTKTTTTTTTTSTAQTLSESSNSNFVKQRFNFNAAHDKSDLAPLMASYVSNLVGNKLNTGSVIQSLPGSLSHLLTARWLAETLNWAGLIVEPEPRRFFALRKQNQQSPGMQILHACVSPTAYPKEVSLHNEDTDVRINSLLDEETSWFNPRVKCFPLYTIMLACNRTQYDLLSLGVHGHELEILKTLPFEKVQIEVISIHLPDDHEDARKGRNSQEYIQAITQYLILKNYKMQRQFGRNYFYQRQHFVSSRTRKEDIFLLKTP